MDANMQRYIDAKVDAVKAQNDARFAEVMAGLDKLNTRITSLSDQTRTQSEVWTGRFDTLDKEVTKSIEASERAETASRSVRWNIVFTGLTVAALCYGAFAAWNQAIEMTTGILSAPPSSNQIESGVDQVVPLGLEQKGGEDNGGGPVIQE